MVVFSHTVPFSYQMLPRQSYRIPVHCRNHHHQRHITQDRNSVEVCTVLSGGGILPLGRRGDIVPSWSVRRWQGVGSLRQDLSRN